MPKRVNDNFPRQALIVSVLGALITVGLTIGVAALENTYAEIDATQRVKTRVAQVKNGIEDGVDLLTSVNQLFYAAGPVSREQFHDFVQPLLEKNPQIGSLSYQRLVSRSERAAFEAEMRRQFPDFMITELSGKHPVPAPDRALYRVVDYLEPFSSHNPAFGLDASSRREQERAVRRACETGLPSASEPFPLADGKEDQVGFVVVMPVYQRNARLDNPKARCGAVLGYTAIAFDSRELVQKTIERQSLSLSPHYEMSVYAAGAADEKNLMYRHVPPQSGHWSWLPTAVTSHRIISLAETFDIAGRPWHIVITSRYSFLNAHLGSLLAWLGGLLTTALATMHTHSLAARSRKIQRIVDQRTADLVTANAHLRARENAIEASINGIIIANAEAPHHIIEYVNPAVERISGFSAAELIGSSCGKLWTGGRDQPGVRKIVDAVNSLEPVRAPLQTRRKDGTAYWAEVQIAPVKDESGRVDRFVVAMHDVTENKRYEAELEYQSKHDELTGLASPNLLRDRLQLAIENAKTDHSAIWVAVIDLDRFKFVNDSLGRRAGDRFLKAIAHRIKSAIRKSDTAGRLGGDEFLLILPQSEDDKTGGSIVQGVMDAVAEPICIDEHEVLLSCCAGMALYPNDGNTVNELIERADIGLHNAKAYGPNSLQCFTPAMHTAVQERLILESALRTALERSELDVYFQPQVDLRTGRVVGIEALVRWNHPKLGEIPPSQFIPVAEECGVITSIDTWVLRTACRQARAWQQAGFGDLRVAVNISARQFNQPGLARMVASVLDETQLPGNLLDIELTERLLMRDAEHTVDTLNALRVLGVQLSIDDFGTGYSSLAYLKRFPIDVLKIDHSFVREISHDVNDAAISDAIISMAHSLGIRVIAEGVETEAQCEFLTRNMCDEIQGYLFSAPLPAAQMELLLAEQKCLPEHLLRMHKRPRTLLLVDDEPNILASLKRLLRGGGYRILTASSGQEGLDLLAQNDVDVIMSDQRMPGMTGVEFLRAVKTSYPDTVRIVLSGFTELKSVTDAVNEGAIYKFLTKPWDDALLRAHIEEAFQHKEMADENHRLSLEVRTANHSLATANRQLEELLHQKRQQIERDKMTLDSVRETLQHIPLPIIGLGEDDIVTFANIAAQNLFKDSRELSGSEAAQVMPEVLHLVRNSDNGSAQNTELGGVRFEVISRAMVQDGQPRGKLITLIPGEFA